MPFVGADEVFNQRDGRARFRDDQGVMHPGELARPLADHRLQGLIDHDVARHIDEGAAVPERIMQRAEFVLVGGDDAVEVRLHQFGIAAHRLVQTGEDDPARPA